MYYTWLRVPTQKNPSENILLKGRIFKVMMQDKEIKQIGFGKEEEKVSLSTDNSIV